MTKRRGHVGSGRDLVSVNGIISISRDAILLFNLIQQYPPLQIISHSPANLLGDASKLGRGVGVSTCVNVLIEGRENDLALVEDGRVGIT